MQQFTPLLADAARFVRHGPGGRQVLLADLAGNLIELFQHAHQAASATT